MSALHAQPDLRLRSGTALWEAPSSTHRFAQRRFDSADGLRHYRAFVAVPLANPPAEGWPAIVMLDGNAAFDDLRQADLDHVPGTVLIGIGYETGGRHDVNARTQDYTPPVPPEDRAGPDDPDPSEKVGGADIFLDLLAERLLPELAKDFSLDPARRSLWGHSYGGLFVIHALFRQPDLFRSYCAVSPSLWWHAPLMLRREETSKRRTEGQSDVVILYDVTQDPRDDERRKARMLQGRAMLAEMLGRLAGRPDIVLTQRAYPGENHGSMFQVGLRAALARDISN
ncbi:alpha/beta hydrolase [Microvirga sp. HBU67558]|uniref:alpha/beta hydrolase n=1 Tax=Microvirga TaxID=186650 RepID=UPI001B377198|nr:MULTISPECIES: alpha/beta hydrolase-fold protein [unclassified Microvirga]MBQ0822414.1 alpha/beta hydrolase [Microvirga sp. HBU67558]